jgi:hypothetical protein
MWARAKQVVGYTMVTHYYCSMIRQRISDMKTLPCNRSCSDPIARPPPLPYYLLSHQAGPISRGHQPWARGDTAVVTMEVWWWSAVTVWVV